jgi:hypothetical protein
MKVRIQIPKIMRIRIRNSDYSRRVSYACLLEVDKELRLVGEVLSISEEPASLAALEESLGKYNTIIPYFFDQILTFLILRLLGLCTTGFLRFSIPMNKEKQFI